MYFTNIFILVYTVSYVSVLWTCFVSATVSARPCCPAWTFVLCFSVFLLFYKQMNDWLTDWLNDWLIDWLNCSTVPMWYGGAGLGMHIPWQVKWLLHTAGRSLLQQWYLLSIATIHDPVASLWLEFWAMRVRIRKAWWKGRGRGDG